MVSWLKQLNVRVLVYGIVALGITAGSLFYSNLLVRKLAQQEEERMKFWAESQDFIWNEHPEYSECEVNFLFQNVSKTNELIPTLVVDSASGNIMAAANLDLPKGTLEADSLEKVHSLYEHLRDGGGPPPLRYNNFGQKILVFYDESQILKQLRYFPYLVFVVIGVFITLIFLGFFAAKRSEQNKVWVGLAKETAHQLGTPVSSLMAWVELLELKAEENPEDREMVAELHKDVERLKIIVERFSKIGSVPELKEVPAVEVLESCANYVRRRMSQKVTLHVTNQLPEGAMMRVNPPLFEWVIENLLKNALDAIPDKGSITIHASETRKEYLIDVEDTGKGIPKGNFRKVFQPGFTTKKRGWGLGLSLTKRIVENYHKGRIFVKSSEIDKGTVFRVVLPK
jgi:two-component sensor histidine kinase